MPSAPLERIDPQRPRWYLRGVVAEHVARYHFARDRAATRGARVLDLACGNGYGCAILAETAANVVGVDLSPDAVAEAAARYASPKVRFVSGDATRVPLESASFDLVTSFETVEHLPVDAIERFLDELHRLLRPGGRLIISTPDRDSYSLGGRTGNPFHPHEFTRAEFLDRLGNRFEIAGVYGQEFAPRWQLGLARSLARGPLFGPVAKAWRAYKMVVTSRPAVLAAGEADSRGAVPMYLVVEAVRT